MKENIEKPTSKVNLQDFKPSIGLDRGVPRWKEGLWYLIKVVLFRSALPYPSKIKVILLRAFGAKVGKRTVIKPNINIHFPWKLDIGNNVWIGEEVFILNFEKVTIGDNVCISQRAFLCGGNHNYKSPGMDYRNGPITLEDGCWVGASCFVGPNVTIGVDTVVVAGSIVTSDVQPNLVCRINPKAFEKSRW
ncbi:WcaF family extracellular polysaccharide biosynthesis acetyltransferase [Aurantibacter sp.]|uniref:WcaF family extracellular polysaccharide biosynthesis acetyltransferase n=1 Tax=Aurantibacter sp. TaxID=2807103 RepID=UPI0032651879